MSSVWFENLIKLINKYLFTTATGCHVEEQEKKTEVFFPFPILFFFYIIFKRHVCAEITDSP